MNNELVTIVIPNYNRAGLIGETLNSIIGQTHQNWECLIVDDGSTDSSVKTIEEYCQKEPRIKLILRPADYPKGANACRNIGKRNAQGKYLIFFDSDDLMQPHHIEEKLIAMDNGRYDFAVAKTAYFNNPENKNPIQYRGLGQIPITADHYITKKIGWITMDPIYKTSVIKNINFTEKNTSAEEYNFFCKLVLHTINAISIDKVLSLRRHHEDSVQGNLNNEKKQYENNFYYYYDTYFEIKSMGISPDAKQYLMDQITMLLYRNIIKLKYQKFSLYLEIIKIYGLPRGLKKIFFLVNR